MMGERLLLITDAVEASAGAYHHVRQKDRFTLPDGTLSGSAITLLQGIRNCVEKVGIPLPEALRMASAYPARLMGIPTALAGDLSFALAAMIGAVSGLLIAPITTVYYDTGFLIGLKGFVGAIIGGLASYPVAAAGSLLVGVLESFSSFWASAYKEVIVFTLIIPVLVWRSFSTHHVDEEE